MSPKIYVACLASYNAGHLFGRWIDASQEASQIMTEISQMLKSSPERHAEEWAVHDYEGFGEIRLSEWPDISRVATIAGLIEKHGEPFSIWYSTLDGAHFEIEALDDTFLEQWHGVHDSMTAFADSLLESTGELTQAPELLRRYFDYEAYARDLSASGDFSFVRRSGQVYVFATH